MDTDKHEQKSATENAGASACAVEQDIEKTTASSTPQFREKSLAHVTAWKYSRAYLKGSGPVVWLAGVAMLILIIAIAVWSVLVSPESLISLLMGQAYR